MRLSTQWRLPFTQSVTSATRTPPGQPPRRRRSAAQLRQLRGSLSLALRLFRDEEQQASCNNRRDAGPERDVDRLLFLHRQLDRAEVYVVRGFRIREFPVYESGDSGHNQKDRDNLERTQDHDLRERPVKRRTMKSRSTAPMNATIRLPISPPPRFAPTALKR